ncbi:RQC domain-containing protein [Sulfobacillus harzensis]|uniref:RQC domain-containing protein n=1 Tax=Sulfobacillus harzensis TaxID=2729629 RepID=A0A7Y0L4S9_9FIRM|nr:RQC-minor-1 family DNA-binding protein [Sulfobacillus harzensis]NMP23324.1 hypothetical protein [Sulfobacillus harzensis]
MARRRSRQTVVLRPSVGRPLSFEEIRAVLRAADTLIGVGGRTVLCKVLKGSREKRVLEHGLDACPVYGRFRDRPSDEVMAMIDQCIRDGYLDIIYEGRLPVLVFTPRGWDIERRTMVEELFNEWRLWAENGTGPATMLYLKDRNRPMIMEFLDKIEREGDVRYIPLLVQWADVDYKKIRQRIASVIAHLEAAENQRLMGGDVPPPS